MNSYVNQYKWVGIFPLFNLFAAACLGLLLRFAFIQEIPSLNYKNVLHGHSHVAMLGWLYLLLTVFLYHRPLHRAPDKTFFILFFLTQASILGMLVSFPIQGYGPVSIVFSTIYLFLAYAFVRKVWLKSRGDLFFRAALLWLVLSTAGIWSLAVVMSQGNEYFAYYHGSVQFFLHFQFNGWFTFAALSLFFRVMEEFGISFSPRDHKTFFVLLMLSTLLTFALALSWAAPDEIMFYVNGLGVVLQVGALYFFLRIVRSAGRAYLSNVNLMVRIFSRAALLSFVLKVIIQLLVVIPSVAVISYTIRLYVIGFFHLILLGMITLFLIAYGLQKQYFTTNKLISKVGWWLILAGFVLMELVLFSQGTMFWTGLGFMPGYYVIIFIASSLLPVGVLCAFTGQVMELVKSNTLNQIAMKVYKSVFMLSLGSVIFACGGGTKNAETDQPESTPKEEVSKGVGQVEDIQLTDPLVDRLIGIGKKSFETKCSGCHKLNAERVVGPGWAGITNKRSPEWIMNMITNVDVMLEEDEEARKLLEECLTRMPNQNIPIDEARGLLEYMRKNDMDQVGSKDGAAD